MAISLSSFLLAGCTFLSTTETSQSDLSLEPGQRSTIAIELAKGHVLTVSASVVGDASVDIGLWLESPMGEVAVPEKRGRSVELTYGAVESGQYHVVVNNSYSLLTGKIISVTTKVEK